MDQARLKFLADVDAVLRDPQLSIEQQEAHVLRLAEARRDAMFNENMRKMLKPGAPRCLSPVSS